MQARVLVGLVLLVGGAGALWAFWPRPAVDDAPSRSITAAAPAGAERVRGAATQGERARLPDASKPLPKRVARGLQGLARRGEGVLAARAEHDFEQLYEPTAASIESGVIARSHRIEACTDVFGLPPAPPLPDREVDGDSVELLLEVQPQGSGEARVVVERAPAELAGCFTEALADMRVGSPRSDGLEVQVRVPIGGE